jgi:hypothetical protein
VLNVWFTTQYQSADITSYVVPSLLLLGLAAGSGLHLVLFFKFSGKVLSQGLRLLALGVVVLLLWVPLFIYGIGKVAPATTQADDYGKRIITNAPPNSVILSDTDDHSFALRYAATVTVKRPDLVLIQESTWSTFDYFGPDLAHFYPDLGLKVPPLQDRTLVNLLLQIGSRRPIIFTYIPTHLTPDFRLQQLGTSDTYLVVAPFHPGP